MTADQATYAAILALDEAASRRRTASARARIGSRQQPTNSRSLRSNSVNHRETLAEHGNLCQLAETRGTGAGGLHPGDVIFWAACVGGAFLLLLSATT